MQTESEYYENGIQKIVRYYYEGDLHGNPSIIENFPSGNINKSHDYYYGELKMIKEFIDGKELKIMHHFLNCGLVVQRKMAKNLILEENAICAISQETIQPNTLVIKLNCNHVFQSDMILQWIRMNPSCPVCRGNC